VQVGGKRIVYDLKAPQLDHFTMCVIGYTVSDFFFPLTIVLVSPITGVTPFGHRIFVNLKSSNES